MSTDISRRKFVTVAGGTAAAVAAMGLVGCSSSDDSEDTSSDTGSSTETEETEETSSTTYIIATDTTFAPFEFTNDDNEFVGIDVDLLAGAMEIAGLSYELQSLGFDAAVAALESGQADGVIAGMSITEEREEKYDFSDPYYDSYVCAAAADGGEITSLEDCAGLTVAAKTGTQSASWAESIADEYGFEISYFDQSDLMYQDVTTGNSACCFEDYPIMSYGVAQGNGLTIIATEEEEYATPYGFAVLKGENQELLEGFNEGLAEMQESGEYDEIIAKYLEA